MSLDNTGQWFEITAVFNFVLVEIRTEIGGCGSERCQGWKGGSASNGTVVGGGLDSQSIGRQGVKE